MLEIPRAVERAACGAVQRKHALSRCTPLAAPAPRRTAAACSAWSRSGGPRVGGLTGRVHLRRHRAPPLRATSDAALPDALEASEQPVIWDDLDVAICGGGPSGLAVALALLAVQPSIKLRVFEAAPAFSEQGAGVLLNVNGARAMEALDPTIVHRLVAGALVPAAMFTYDDVTGQRMPWVQAVQAKEALAEMGFAPCIVQWSDIRESLYASLPPGIVEFGCRVTSCTPPPGEVSGGGGGEEEEPDCFVVGVQRTVQAGPHGGGAQERQLAARARHVIAADGYFSRVRRGAGDGQTPDFRQRVMWRGSLTRDELTSGSVPVPNALDTESNPDALSSSHVWMSLTDGKPPPGPPERVTIVYPAGGSRLVWSLFTPLANLEKAGHAYPREGAEGGGRSGGASPGGEDRGVHQAGAWGAESLRRGLAAFAHLPEDLRAMLAATPPQRVTEHGYYGHDLNGMLPGAWARGRLLAVGDAAHTAPPDGQGANLAMEDAAELGAAVRKYGLGPQAFAAWEALRQPRVRAILGDMTPQATVRTPLIRGAAFDALWSPRRLVADGRVPADVLPGSAAGDEAEEVKAVQAWSQALVRQLLEKQLEGRTLAPAAPPPGGWRFR